MKLYMITIGITILLIICTVVSVFISDAITPVAEVVKPVWDEEYNLTVPSSSIITGAYDRKYVYVARERKGLFGPEYYLILSEVALISDDGINAAIGGRNVTNIDDVLVFPSIDLFDGDMVKILK